MCDGGSKDNTVQKVKDFSQRVNVPVKVTHSQPGGFFQSLNSVINVHVWIQKFFPKVGVGGATRLTSPLDPRMLFFSQLSSNESTGIW